MNESQKMYRIAMLRSFQNRLSNHSTDSEKSLTEKSQQKTLRTIKKTCLWLFPFLLFTFFVLYYQYFYFLTRPYGFSKETYPKMEVLFNRNYARINAVLKYSRLHQFEPLLTTAIIYAESSNYAFTISSVEARGLMQVREETGFDAAFMYGKKPILAGLIKRYPDILYHPGLNIYLSTLYIKTYKNLYKWNWEQALHAYNVGPNAFLRGKRHQYYVNRIMRFYHNWTRLSAEEIKRHYCNELYAIFGKKLSR